MGSIRTGEKAVTRYRLGETEPSAVCRGTERLWPGQETRIWLHLTSSLSISLYWSLSEEQPQYTDWGDGVVNELILTMYFSHRYAEAGDYIASPLKTNALYVLGPGTKNLLNKAGTKTDTSPEVTRIEIGGEIKEIADYALSNMTELRVLTVPTWVSRVRDHVCKGSGIVLAELGAAELDDYLFQNCPALQKVWLRENVKRVSASAFSSIGSGATIYCEADTEPAGFESGWNGGLTVVWGQKVRPW